MEILKIADRMKTALDILVEADPDRDENDWLWAMNELGHVEQDIRQLAATATGKQPGPAGA